LYHDDKWCLPSIEYKRYKPHSFYNLECYLLLLTSSNPSGSLQVCHPTFDQDEDEGIRVRNLDRPRETTEKSDNNIDYERNLSITSGKVKLSKNSDTIKQPITYTIFRMSILDKIFIFILVLSHVDRILTTASFEVVDHRFGCFCSVALLRADNQSVSLHYGEI